jgi:CopG family nickel-responsive transcriptional regulator
LSCELFERNCSLFVARKQLSSIGRYLAAERPLPSDQHGFRVIIMKGPGVEVKHLADHMLSMRGVKHGKLVMTSTGKSLK